jgi:ABC-type Fe3+-hydroxamate transport system substrate-binding protein
MTEPAGRIRNPNRLRFSEVMKKNFLFIGWLLATLAAFGQPMRIVSTSPSITETLFALGLGNRVVGVSTYCRYPPEVLHLPKIGTYARPDPEKIAILRPDLAIIHSGSASLPGRLAALRIEFLEVSQTSLSDVYVFIREIGRAAGVTAQADRLVQNIRTRLEAIQSQSQGFRRPSVLLLVGKDPGMLTNMVGAGPKAYLGELLEIAGGRNVLDDVVKIPYPRISLETVVRLDPDLILDASGMGDLKEDVWTMQHRMREPWLQHRELSAVRNGRVVAITSEALVVPGPRVVDAVESMRKPIREASGQ